MKPIPSIFTIFTFASLFIMTGCSLIFSRIYGIKTLRPVDEKTIIRFSEKYNIPVQDCYELDTTYVSFLNSVDTSRYKVQQKNHYQPLQALYYDKKGQLLSFQINCYAGGFPNLNWDRNDIMTTFPPKQQAPIDSLIPLEMQLKFLRPLAQTIQVSVDEFDYLVIVYWSRFMGRQSKRFIEFIQENSKLVTDRKVKLIYVNNDNVYAEY